MKGSSLRTSCFPPRNLIFRTAPKIERGASALADPRFVGVHWFQWIDQPASGRKDRENHQCGFIDVAGREYAELVKITTRATTKMYPARVKSNQSTEKLLKEIAGK